jgi:acetolactate synthase-1/2/3 large subunit
MLTKHNLTVSDYLVRKLTTLECGHVFMVTGGAAMHLNDAFGRYSGS